MTTIAIVLVAIANALKSPEQGANYFNRPRGSHIPGFENDGDSVASLLQSMSFVEVTDEARNLGVSFGACRYFRADLGAALGVEAVALVSELTPEELGGVRLKPGHHGGFELVAESLPMRPTSIVHLIIGNGSNPHAEATEETATVFSWYPGRLTANVDLKTATVKLGS